MIRFTSALARAAGYVRLSRPGDTALAFCGTILGAGLAGVREPALLVVALAASNGLLSAASMMVNDWHDVEEDSVNRPDRPIPSGLVPRHHALVGGVALFTLGISAAAAAGPRFGVAALMICGLSVLYSLRLKSMPLLGNGLTALLSAYPLWCWVLLGEFAQPLYVGAALGFFVAGAGREIVRTAADADGDTAHGIRTIATLHGPRVANHVGLALIASGLAIAWFAALGASGPAYSAALAIATATMLLAGGYHLRTGLDSAVSRRLTALARTMTGLLALAVAWDLLASGWLWP